VILRLRRTGRQTNPLNSMNTQPGQREDFANLYRRAFAEHGPRAPKPGDWRSKSSSSAVPLTRIQTDILRLLAAHRDPESYVAGASPLNRDAPRMSDDIAMYFTTGRSGLRRWH
jgi:hypothetical protein